MAVNLGRGGVVNTQPDSSQLLSTGAIFRQQAEQNTKAQAGLILQDLKAEADNRGWSMKRMAEMYPDQFKAASAAMLGGGNKGLAGADKMWAETIGGMETADQYEKYLYDKQLVANAPANEKYIEILNQNVTNLDPEKQAANAAEQAGPQWTTEDGIPLSEEEATRAQEGVTAIIDQIKKNPTDLTSVASLSIESRQELVSTLQEQADAGNMSAKKVLEDLKAAENTEEGVFSAAQNGILGGVIADLYGGEGTLSSSMLESTAGSVQPALEETTSAQLNQFFQNTPGYVMGNESGQLLSVWKDVTPEDRVKFINFMDRNADHSAAEKREYSRLGQKYGVATEMLPPIDVPVAPEAVPGRELGGLPQLTPKGVKSVEQDTTPVAPKETQQTEQVVGGFVGRKAGIDDMLAQAGNPINQRTNQVTAGRQAQADVVETQARAEYLREQAIGQAANTELAYAASEAELAALLASGGDGVYDETTSKDALAALQASRKVNADFGVPATMSLQALEGWASGMSSEDRLAFNTAQSAFIQDIVSNDYLGDKYEVLEVAANGRTRRRMSRGELKARDYRNSNVLYIPVPYGSVANSTSRAESESRLGGAMVGGDSQ